MPTEQGNQGGGAGAATQGAADAAAKQIPYLSQASPTHRENKEILEDLQDSPTINDLIANYSKAKRNASRSILIPNAEHPDPAEVKAFYQKMGIPEPHEDYEINTDAFKDVASASEIAKTAREHARAMGLNKTQAQKYFENIATLAKGGRDGAASAMKQYQDTFESRLLEAVGKDEAKKAATINLMKAGLVKHFGDEGLLNRLKETGLLYDPVFAQKIAAIEERLGDAQFVKGSGEGAQKTAPRGAQGTYSPAWEAQFGKNAKGGS